MATPHREFDELQEDFGITFGLGIDFETQYERFLTYSACGGQEGDSTEVNIHTSELPEPVDISG